MARFYSNENFPLPVVEALRRWGHDVLTTPETGETVRAQPDAAVLAFATTATRVLLTLNRRHFIRLHLDGIPHAGIVACTFDPAFERLALRIHEAVQTQDPLAGKLVRVNRTA